MYGETSSGTQWAHQLDASWERAWFGGSGGGGPAAPPTPARGAPASAQGRPGLLSLLSLFIPWLFGGDGRNAGVAGSASSRRPLRAGRAGAPARRARAVATDSAQGGRLPRRTSVPKLTRAPSNGGVATDWISGGDSQEHVGSSAHQHDGSGGDATLAADSSRGTSAAGTGPGRPARPQDSRAVAGTRAARQAANYAERRQAWRQRWVHPPCVGWALSVALPCDSSSLHRGICFHAIVFMP